MINLIEHGLRHNGLWAFFAEPVEAYGGDSRRISVKTMAFLQQVVIWKKENHKYPIPSRRLWTAAKAVGEDGVEIIKHLYKHDIPLILNLQPNKIYDLSDASFDSIEK